MVADTKVNKAKVKKAKSKKAAVRKNSSNQKTAQSSKKAGKKDATGGAETRVRKQAKKRAGKKRASKAPARSKAAASSNERNAVTASNKTENGSAMTVHCTLASMEAQALLIPTSVVAEIIEFRAPQPIDSAPEWLLGQIDWEDWQVPVISYNALVNGVMPEHVTKNSRTLIIKSLSEASRVPYLGVLIADLPKLSQVTEADLEEMGDEAKSLGVHSHISFKGNEAIIPDLDRLSQLVAHAAFGTLTAPGHQNPTDPSAMV